MSESMIGPALLTFGTVMWAILLWMLLRSYAGDKPARTRMALTLVGLWMAFCVVRLWADPAFEPLWLQYLLLVALPGVVGFGFAAAVAWFRRRSSAESAEQGDAR